MNAERNEERAAGAVGNVWGEAVPELVSEPAAEPTPEDDLIMATARRIIATDAAIIHRLGTI